VRCFLLFSFFFFLYFYHPKSSSPCAAPTLSYATVAGHLAPLPTPVSSPRWRLRLNNNSTKVRSSTALSSCVFSLVLSSYALTLPLSLMQLVVSLPRRACRLASSRPLQQLLYSSPAATRRAPSSTPSHLPSFNQSKLPLNTTRHLEQIGKALDQEAECSSETIARVEDDEGENGALNLDVDEEGFPAALRNALYFTPDSPLAHLVQPPPLDPTRGALGVSDINRLLRRLKSDGLLVFPEDSRGRRAVEAHLECQLAAAHLALLAGTSPDGREDASTTSNGLCITSSFVVDAVPASRNEL
jgi:hypothetical protein